MRITKKYMFAAAHSIDGAGKCANKHGHNWEVTVEVDHVGGEISHPAGFLADVRDLKDAGMVYDHDDLDNYFDWASTENVAQRIADDSLRECQLVNPKALFYVRVHLDETPNNSADAVATNVGLHVLNKGTGNLTLEVDQEDRDAAMKNPRLVGLKGAAQNYESDFDEENKTLVKPELDKETENAD